MSEETAAAPVAASTSEAAAPVPAPVAEAPAPQTQPQAAQATDATPQPVSFELSAPEGLMLTDAGKAHIQELAKERGWDQQTAQDYADTVAEQARASVESSLQRYEQQRAEWRSQIQKDPELGGQNFERTVHRCGALMNKIDPKGELREYMNATGIGDNPVVVRAFENIARYLIPDDIATAGAPSKANAPLADRMGFNFKPRYGG